MRSPKITIVLIVSISFFFFLSALIPQKNLANEESFHAFKQAYPLLFKALNGMQLTNIYNSYIFLVILSLCFINLLYYSYYKTLLLYKTNKHEMNLDTIKIPENLEYSKVHVPFERAKSALQEKYRRNKTVLENNTFLIFIHKNKINNFSTLLFHVSLIIIVAGGIISVLTKFSGVIELTEEQELYLSEKNFKQILRKPRLKLRRAPVLLKLLKFTPVYYKDNTVQNYTSEIYFAEKNKGAAKTIHMSSPFAFSGYTIYQHDISGVSGLLVLQDAKKNILHQTYLLFDAPQKPEGPYTASYQIPKFHYLVSAELYADYDETLHQSKSRYVRNPRMFVKIKYLISKPEASGNLSLNEKVNFGNKTLTFANTKYWSSYIVSADRGASVAIFGFFCVIVSIILLLFEEQKIFILLTKENKRATLAVWGWTKKHSSLFKENLNKLKQDLTDLLKHA